jgi:citrate lyase subunit beta/citryl-CoA lyase
MKNRIQRSMLILPVNNGKFIAKAHLRGADAIVLDIEDAVPPGEKIAARNLLKDAIKKVGSGGADVFVRVNNEPELIRGDIEASLYEGLYGLFIPKIDSGTQVREIEQMIAQAEKEMHWDHLPVSVSLHVESPRGIMRFEDIACAGARTESMSLGVDDYCREMGIEPSEEGDELLFPLTHMVIVCAAFGIRALGVQGSVAGFKDLTSFENAAGKSRNLGCKGAYCIHPDQVPILNRVFSPSPARVAHARRIVAAFEDGLKNGRAAVSLDNRMVDTPIYKQALACLELAEGIGDLEQRKQRALEGVRS